MAPLRFTVVLTLLPVVVGGGTARAEAPPSSLSPQERTARSKAHYNLGRAHLDLHEYEQAMTEFERGYEYKPMPLFLYNIGQVARMSGQREKALDYFQRYLEAEPKAPERPAVEKHIAGLKLALAREKKVEPPKPSEPPPPPVVPQNNAAVTEPTPPPEVAPAAVVVTTSPPPPAETRRSRKKVWIALGVVGAVLVLGGVTTAIVLNTVGNSSPPPIPNGYSDWGQVDVRKQP
jgi:hypothetical protein